jgi:hypothetical protein
MAFRDQQEWENRAEARRLAARIGGYAALATVAVTYSTLGKTIGIYDWRGGLLSVLAILISFARSAQLGIRWYKLRLAPTCPVCGGVFSVEEKTLRKSTMDGDDNLPTIVDRVSTCESCGRQHHRVYAATGESGLPLPMSITQSLGIMFDRKSLMQRHFPGKTDAEIDQMLAELDALPRKPAMTRAEWEQLFRRLQQEAEAKNREQRMTR